MLRGLVAVVVFLLPALRLSAQDAVTGEPREGAGIHVELEPSIVEAISKLTDTAGKSREIQGKKEIDADIVAFKEAHQLDEASVAILETAAKQAVADSMTPWKEDFDRFLTLQMKRMSVLYAFNQSSLMRQLSVTKAEDIVERFQGIEATLPRSQKVWTEAMAKVLPEAAIGTWKQSIAETHAKKEEAIDQFFEEFTTSAREDDGPVTQALIDEVIKVAKPDDEAAGKIRRLAEGVADASFDAWVFDTRFVLLRTLDTRWREFAQTLPPNEVTKSSEWKTGLAKILSPDQAKLWEEEVDRRMTSETEKFLLVFNRDLTKQKAAFETQIEDVFKDLVETIEPDDAVKKKLDEAAKQAVSESLDARKEAGLRVFRMLRQSQRAAVLKSSRFNSFADETVPSDQTAWTQAVATLLTPAQSASWEAERAKRLEDDSKRLADMVDATADSYEIQFQSGLDPHLTDIVSTLKLDEKRAKAFEEAGKAAVKQSIDTWKKRATEWLENLSLKQRENYTEQGRVPLGYNTEDAADKQPAWTEAFAKILTPEESQRWSALQETRTKHRKTAISDLMISLIEEWVGLDEKQWEQLRPICAEGANSLVQQLNEQHFYMNLNQIAQPLKALDEKKLGEILDPSQQDRWKWAVTLLESRNRGRTQLKGPDPKTIPPGQDLVAVEDVITELIYQRNREKKDEMMTLLKSEIEIGSRAAKLSPEVVEQLLTAGKGATDEVVHQWDSNFAKYVRGRVKGANPRTIHQMLAGVGNYNNDRETPLDTAIWKRSLSLLLDESQTRAWQTATERRAAMRRNATAAMVSVYFEGRLGLDEKQGGRLREKLAIAVQTYGPDIESYFSSWSSPWYLQYYSIGLPLMGIPEKELKELLSKDQFTIWEQQFQGNASNYWDSIESRHKQRTKKDQKKEEKS